MRMTDEEIAMYKIAEAMRVIDFIRDSDEFVKLFDDIVNFQRAPESKWKTLLEPLLSGLHISIKKPTERPESFDDLSGSLFQSRLAQRSCHNPLCKKPHCQDCDKCGHKRLDGHLCRCPVCGLEYISSADGEEHNLEGECKESSEEV